MSTRNLRNRISSRQPSPVNGYGVDPGLAGAEMLDDGDAHAGRTRDQDDVDEAGDHAWVEPAVRKLPPSYQDHKGLERIGVLELQQPLGDPPSSKILQRLKLNMPRASPRPTSLATDDVVTPSGESERQELPLSLGSPMDIDGSAEPSQPDLTLLSTPPRGRPAKRDVAEMKHTVPLPEVTPSPIQSTFSSTTLQVAHKPVSIQEHLRQDRVQNYVDRAIQEAEDKGDAGLVPGLRRICHDALHKRDLYAVLEAIAHNQPNEEQLSIFKKFIKKGVKRHRRGTATPTPSNAGVNSPQPGQPACDPSQRTRPQDLPPHSSTQPNSSVAFTSPFRTRLPPSHLHPDQATSKSAGPSPSSKRHKMSSTGDRSHRHARSTDGVRRRRSRSHSSSSSLSSARSIPDDFAPPTDDQPEAPGADERPLKNGQLRQATDRSSVGNKTRATAQPTSKTPFNAFTDVGKLNGKKFKKPRDDLDSDASEIDKARQRHLEDSYQDYNYKSRAETNDRYRVPHSDEEYPSTETGTLIPPPVVHPYPVEPVSNSLRGGLDPLDMDLQNGTSRKRRYEEIDEEDIDISTSLSSSPVPPFAPPPPAGVLASRSGTPRMPRIPAINKARKSARVMISPNKPKNGGITAGIARVGPGRDSAIGNGADSSAEDNDEFCASCGGEGTLLCCDGCTKSMHHACLEPPLNPDDEVVGEWFCPVCTAKRKVHTGEVSGFLGKVIRSVENIIPKAFTLPSDVREYFEGVRTGDSGEYEEFGQIITQQGLKQNRSGALEERNYKEPRDNKGKLITCYKCGLGTNGRDIIPCSYCPARWHLDCCDPPLAVPPRRRNDKPSAIWRCPLHVEQDLAAIGRQAEFAPGELGRQPRPRKPKNARPIDVDMPRGFRNNGIIEVELMKEDAPAIREVDMNGQIFRLPEKGIRLDFIDRVKRSWYEDQSFPELSGRPQKLKEKLYRPDGAAIVHPPKSVVFTRKEPNFYTGSQAVAITETAKANAVLRRKTFSEQQAILGLAMMGQKRSGFTGDTLTDLINQLIIDAPPAAEAAIERGEKAQLVRLQELIASRLRILDSIVLPNAAPKLAPRAPPLLAPRPPGVPPPGMQLAPQQLQSPYAQPGQYHSQPPMMRQDSYGSAQSNGVNGDGLTGASTFQQQIHQPPPPPPSDMQYHQQQMMQGVPQSESQQVTEIGDPAIDPRLFNGVGDLGMDGMDDLGTLGTTAMGEGRYRCAVDGERVSDDDMDMDTESSP